ncbi:tetratricopeptide repeat protein [Candidatus Falkowbacteria bacterium]|nr:tetratricopeptide repeat protein [Candidatus Falkowbacteria bacterium]
MSQKIYLIILKTGIYAAFLSFIIVANNLLFPFITSKQIYFNILIEVLFVVWMAFLIKYPAWQPFKKENKNLITWGLVAFFGALLMSLLATVDVNMSFWGDIERMLGIFHLLHFLVFYFIIITVMKNARDWKFLLLVSVITGTLVALKAVNGVRHSYIGNAAYVAAVYIFNIYFAIILFFKEKSNWKWLYLLPIMLMLQGFIIARISGAYVGLGFSVICFFFLLGVLHKNKKIKIATLVLFLLMAGSTYWIFTHKDHSLVKDIEPIQEISIGKNTFQTRLISWRAAINDFQKHWFLGVGHGNYSIIFDKYFDPSFFNHTKVETYFDRAHNNILDIASTTGIVGLLTYLSIFVALGIYLIKAYRRGRIGVLEFSLISSLLIAYFVQNLAVFDSLVTYISLMVLLGYVHWIANYEENNGNIKDVLNKEGDKAWINNEIYALGGIGLIILMIMWNYNILPIKMLQGTIAGQRAFAEKDFSRAIDEYREALKYDTPLDRDSRFTLVRSAVSNYWQMSKMSQDERDEDILYVIEQAEKNTALSPHDTLLQMQLARSYDIASKYLSDQNKREEYAKLAIDAIDRSIAASPGRIPVYFIKSQILLNQGKKEEALEVLEYAATLNDNYYESYCQIGQVYLMPKEVTPEEQEIGMENLLRCFDNGGYNLVVTPNAIKRGINYFITTGEEDKILKLYEQLVKYEPRDPKNWINLAKLYDSMGKYKKAIDTAKTVIQIDPNTKADAEEFIKTVEQKMENGS